VKPGVDLAGGERDGDDVVDAGSDVADDQRVRLCVCVCGERVTERE